MSLLRKVGKNSFIYTGTTVLQRGISFLLLPLYTRYLTPDDYGILAVVGSLTGVLLVLFTLSLHGAATRYFFVYRENAQVLREFWGTVLTAVFLISAGSGAVLLMFGREVMEPISGNIAFWPYIALGIATAALQPVSVVFLSILQTKEEAGRYAGYTLMQFIMNVSLVVALVIFMGWKAEGPLLAGLVTALTFSFVSLYVFRSEFRICLKLEHLSSALRYSLPLVPHSLASQVAVTADRVFLNHMVSTASAGLYNIGSMFGGIMAIVTDSVNRAYVPVSMDVLQSRDAGRLDELRRIGLIVVAAYSLLATALSLFAKEAIELLTTKAFYESYVVVPFIAFSFVLYGIYYVFVNILFFHVRMTKVVLIGTVLGAVLNVVLNYALIKGFGLIGAAVATLLASLATTIVIAVISRKHELVAWEYRKFALIPSVCLSVAVGVNAVEFGHEMILLGVKVVSMIALYCLISFLLWRDVFFLIRHGVGAMRTQARALRSAALADR